MPHEAEVAYNAILARCNFSSIVVLASLPSARGRVDSRHQKGSVVNLSLSSYFNDSPIQAVALFAALVALASTPVAFAVLGQMEWFEARRGRTMRKPSFVTIISGMMLVMGIPAIFAALVIKSQYFDKNRYEFDPNKTWSVLEQGRSFNSLKEADEAIRKKEEDIALVKKNLLEGVKKLDEAMLTLRAASAQSPATAQALPNVLERLASIRKAVAVDGPQQLMDFTAPPAVLAPTPNAYSVAGGQQVIVMAAPGTVPGAVAAAPTGPAAAGASAAGLAKETVAAELATVPEPQRPLAAMLPLSELPQGWEVTKYNTKHLETFNADNLFEKIDGRAESFTQNNVVGMAYTSYHPVGDDSNEIQVYIFEFDHSKPFRAQSKYNSEKPEKSDPVKVGTEGYSAAGSLLFYADPYYTQIVSTKDDKQFADISLELAKRIAVKQVPEGGSKPGSMQALQDAIYALFPKGQNRGAPTFASADVFGYSFLSDVFMADYKEEGVTWQGFLRPFVNEDEAKAVFEKYVAAAKQNGGNPKMLTAEGADQMFLSSSIGLVDVIFRKGNVIGGANGVNDAQNNEAKAQSVGEAFAKGFVKSLPKDLPKGVPSEPKSDKPGEGEQD